MYWIVEEDSCPFCSFFSFGVVFLLKILPPKTNFKSFFQLQIEAVFTGRIPHLMDASALQNATSFALTFQAII